MSRSQEDILNWKKRDPILRLTNALLNEGICTSLNIESLDSELNVLIEKAWQKALISPYPDKSSLISRVYAN